MAIVPPPEPEVVLYAIRFPAELDADQVTTWLHSWSGLLPGGLGRLWGAPTIVLELRASAEQGFEYRLIVPRSRADYVVGQLRAQLPEARVTPSMEMRNGAFEDSDEMAIAKDSAISASSSDETRVVELGVRKPERSLFIELMPLSGSLWPACGGSRCTARRRASAVDHPIVSSTHCSEGSLL